MNEFNIHQLDKQLSHDELTAIALENYNLYTVLGLDIYQYSNFPKEEQFYIPILFDILYNSTIEHVLVSEQYFFQHYGLKDEFKENFISTGDGGYQIFENPLQAILFANIFQAGLKAYNANRILDSKLRNIKSLIVNLDLRYAVTTGLLYKYNANFFGAPIINNSRMMSKDRLNRLLFDQLSIDWLVSVIDTPENLMLYNKIGLDKLEYFNNYKRDMTSTLFERSGKVLKFDAMKIGDIKAKDDVIGVFNIYVQSLVRWNKDKSINKPDELIITLGNLNISGIE